MTSSWNQLSDRTRRLLLLAGAVEGSLKLVALADLARRPPSEVRGSKARWAAAITLVNAVGIVPIVYLTRGRRKPTG